MPSVTAYREHRSAAAVMAAGRRYREPLASTLVRRLEEDGALEAMEGPPSSDDPLVVAQLSELSEAETEAVIGSSRVQLEMGPVRLPDLDNLPRLAVWMIAYYTVKMLAADALIRQERQEDVFARRARDEAAEAAYEALWRLRKYVAGVLDEAAAASLLDLDGQTPRNPFRLRDTLNVAVSRLRSPETLFPQAHFEGAQPDWDRLADELEAYLLPLDEAILRVEDEKTAAEALLAETRAAFETYRRALRGWRTVLLGFATAGGDLELAGRFRLPRFPRRDGGTDDEGFEEETDGELPPVAGDPAAPDEPSPEPPEETSDGAVTRTQSPV